MIGFTLLSQTAKCWHAFCRDKLNTLLLKSDEGRAGIGAWNSKKETRTKCVMKLSAPWTAALEKPGESERVCEMQRVEKERDGVNGRQWVHFIIKRRHHLPHPVNFSYPHVCSLKSGGAYPKTHTHTPAARPSFSTVFPPHLCVLGWIMQGLYPALKHEWIIWPQGQAVSTFPFTFLFIYLFTHPP